jgi:hypothetical protein
MINKERKAIIMKITKLLDTKTMLENLIKVNDIPHLQERFYPKLIKRAGDELNGLGVLLAVQIAIAEYTEGMPPMMAHLMQFQVEDFCAAMINDQEVLADAKRANYEARNN